MKRAGNALKLLLIAGLIALPGLLAAQSGFNDEVLDNPVPFDGGVGILVAAAIGYGLKKIYHKKKKMPFN